MPPVIEGFWIRNFRTLKQIAVGSSFQQATVAMEDVAFQPYELGPFTLFVGPNGSGKSTLLDAFSLLNEVLLNGTESAFAKRGGFQSVVSQGMAEEAITFGFEFRACADPRPLTYIVSFEGGKSRAPIISNEAILYRPDQEHPENTTLLFFQNGIKTTRHVAPWPGVRMEDLQRVKVTDAKHLALETLGRFEDYPDVFPLRQILINWTCSTMALDLSAGLNSMVIPRTKNEQRSAFLLEQIKVMEEKHHYDMQEILPHLVSHLPRVEKILLDRSESGRWLLRLKMESFDEPFEAFEVSPGLLRLFAYALLLEDPIPYPLIGLDDLDDSLDELHCRKLVSKLYHHVDDISSTQFFASAHSPYLIDQVDPNDVWVLETAPDGFATIYRAADDLAMRNVNLDEMPPETRWYTDILSRPYPSNF